MLQKYSQRVHCFKNLYPWKNLTDFSNFLKSNIVYNEGGLVALNKPYGVKIYSRKEKADSTVPGAVNLASQEDFPYSLEDFLPHLKDHLNAQDLQIIKSAERYTSGITLLGSGEEVKNKVIRSRNVAKHEKVAQYIYWAVANGNMLHPDKQQVLGIKLIDVKSEKQPIIVNTFSKNDVEKRRVKPVFVHCRTIASNQEATLLEIGTSSVKWHFLRVYATSLATSILGDTMYGSRTKMLLGKPININPENIQAYDVQPLPKVLCQKLDLSHSVEGHLLVPTMLHFRTMILPKYFKDKDLIINAPAPSHFSWTCSRLDFTLPD